MVCLAAKHTMEGFVNNRLFRMLGGIPVNREGNTVPVLLRAKECLDQGKNADIFPEVQDLEWEVCCPLRKGVHR